MPAEGNNMALTHAVIFTGGDSPNSKVLAHLADDALVIAADSGYGHAQSLGVQPHLLVGDMDSIAASDVADAQERKIEIHTFDAAKDETDTEIAISYAMQRGIANITVVSGGGDRFDHLLGMVHSLATTHCTLYIGNARVCFARPDAPASLSVSIEDVISLIPIGGSCVISTTGLQWNLSNEELQAFASRGVSNTATNLKVSVTVTLGSVAIIQPFFLGGRH
jgi:thiamine pyrophosphokinase